MTSSTEGMTSLNEHELCKFDNVSSKSIKIELCDDQCKDIVANEIDTESIAQSREITLSDKSDSVESVLELFPFICGICEAKFNQLPQYIAHIETHESVDNLLHCCNEHDFGSSGLFRCSLCDLKFPSLCTIYRHVTTVENLHDFVYKSSNNTIYAFTPNNEDSFGVTVTSDDKNEMHRAIENEDNFGLNIIDHQDHENEIHRILENEDGNSDSEDERRRNMEKEIKIEKDNVTDESYDSVQGRVRKLKKRKKTRIVHGQVNRRMEPDTMDGENIDGNKANRNRSGMVKASSTSGEPIQRPTNKQNDLFPCEVCGGFYKYANLKKHRTIHDERTYTCDQCHKVYKSQFTLNAHKKHVHIEEKRYTCEECGKCFKAAKYLRQHRQVHVKECNIQCVECSMKFRYKALLKAHMRTHSEVKPFQCEQCDRTFKQAHELRFHTNSFHTDERTFACTECNKKFKTFKHMKQHHWVHLPPRYFCQICGKGFIQKANMRLHVKIHGIQV